MPPVYVLQHAASETLGTIAYALDAAGVSSLYVRAFDGDPIPQDMAGVAGLVVMGGPMGVSEQDRYPFLSAEIRLIQQAWQDEKPILGVCLGSQLLAAALGASVARAPQAEIGWYPVTMTPSASDDPLWAGIPASWMGFHWHGDAHALPSGTTLLAHTALTPCQAFRAGRSAYGLQFHMEVTRPMIDDWLSVFSEEIQAGGQDAAQIAAGANAHLAGMQSLGAHVFTKWAGLVAGV